MDDRFNTIAGWALGAGIVLLGGVIVTGEMFKAERPERMGYPIAGVVEEGGGAEAEQPIAYYLQTADAGRGEAVFRRCTACHTIAQGGPNGLGPNLYGVMGEAIATGHGGYAFSDPLRAHSGASWDWETMSQWLHSPRIFAQGTRMTFAGLSDPQDRADVMLYLNANGGHLTVPPPPAAAPGSNEAAPAGNAAAPAGNAAAPAGNAAAPAANQAAPAPAGNAH